MSTTTKDPNAAIKAQAEEIVASGAEVSPRLAEVVTRNACQSQQSGMGLIGLVQEVMDGARAGLDRAVPQDRDDVLRQVVDGLGDGLSQAVLAGRLALEEAARAHLHHATEDLARFRDDLAAVHDLFAETLERGLTSCKGLTTAQVAAARTHLDRVAERLSTELEALKDAVRQHPEAFAREGLRAGASMGQCAAGALFQAVGRMLPRAGDLLHKESKPGR